MEEIWAAEIIAVETVVETVMEIAREIATEMTASATLIPFFPALVLPDQPVLPGLWGLRVQSVLKVPWDQLDRPDLV